MYVYKPGRPQGTCVDINLPSPGRSAEPGSASPQTSIASPPPRWFFFSFLGLIFFPPPNVDCASPPTPHECGGQAGQARYTTCQDMPLAITYGLPWEGQVRGEDWDHRSTPKKVVFPLTSVSRHVVRIYMNLAGRRRSPVTYLILPTYQGEERKDTALRPATVVPAAVARFGGPVPSTVRPSRPPAAWSLSEERRGAECWGRRWRFWGVVFAPVASKSPRGEAADSLTHTYLLYYLTCQIGTVG